MKILYLLYSFTIGGTEKLVSDICNEMHHRKHTVFLYIVNDLHDDLMLNNLDRGIQIKLQNRKAAQGDKAATLLQIAKYVYVNKIDVIHCNSLNSPELVLFAKLIKPYIRVFYTVHGMQQYKTLNKYKVMYRNVICNRIIAISKSVEKDIISSGAWQNKVEVIYNAIDVNKYVNTEKEKNFNKNNIIIGNVARFIPEVKGQDILMNAIEILKKSRPNIKCIFAGAPDEKHKKDFKQTQKKVIKCGLEKNITMLGNVLDIPKFLKGIDIFVLPSRLEGFGISLLEAMCMGIPCIASRLDGPEEILEFGKRGKLFEPQNPAALATLIDQVIENYDEEKSIAEKNAQFVRTTYSIDEMCNKLVDLYFR